MFDKFHLPQASFEFVVISDTHYLREGDRAIYDFQSRQQEFRVETALKQVAALEAPLVIHLGDLVSAIPERVAFTREMAEALQQMGRFGINAHHVAGNHDVGDKPDPIAPAPPVQKSSLAWYHSQFGRSWYSFDHRGCHFVILNAQLMNSALPESQHQQDWLAGDLSRHSGKRIFLFLHMPPYLWEEDEPGLGHYEIIDEPARSWLLQLVRRHRVELLVAGHVHFAAYDHIGATRFFILSSTSFSRALSGYLFASCPPEQSRDDFAKLGFYLFRVLKERVDVHFIRTNGATGLPPEGSDSPRRLITRTSAGLTQSPLGLTLRYPLTPTCETPVGRKSRIRKRIRNDYPLMTCIELGLKRVRVPWRDLNDSLQSRRLAIAREEGLGIIATAIWFPTLDLPAVIGRDQGRADAWEIQIPGTLQPPADCLAAIKECRTAFQIPIFLSAILPKQIIPGKQYSETRVGYQVDELAALNQKLAENDSRVERVLCRIGPKASPWQLVGTLQQLLPFSHIDAINLAVGLHHDDRQNARRVAEAVFATPLLPGSHLFFEPLVDFERDIEVTHGLLDSMYNPRPPFHVLRCLNTILYGAQAEKKGFLPDETEGLWGSIKSLTNSEKTRLLLLPGDSVQKPPQGARRPAPLADIPPNTATTVYWLEDGTSWRTTLVKGWEAVATAHQLAFLEVAAEISGEWGKF